LIALLASVAIGFGLVLAFDGLTRPRQSVGRERRVGVEAVAAGIGGGGAYLLSGWPVAALAGLAVGAAVPKVLSEQHAARRRIELTDALAEAAAGLRDAVRGGLGLNEGLAGLAAWGPELVREQVATLAAEASRLGPAPAAARFARRMNDPGADLLAATLSFSDRVGGRQVAEVLDAMAEELAAEARTVRELRARQARQRASARIVAVAPVALLLILRQVNPGYLEAYDTPAGQAVLALAAVLVAVGYALMLRIARVIDPPRIKVAGER
jgi:tight adherence protein B